MGNLVQCGQCGKTLTEASNVPAEHRQPCPHCGSLSRAFSVFASGGIVMGGHASARYIPYQETLLKSVRDLIDRDEPTIATVVAHMAAEFAAERALSAAYAKKGIGDLEDVIEDFLNGHNLGNDRIRKLYTAISGDEIQKQPFWAAFKAHSERRNKAVHEARLVTKAEAEATLKAVTELIDHLGIPKGVIID